MTESINIELVTPSEMLFTETADRVVVPGLSIIPISEPTRRYAISYSVWW